MLSFIVGSIIGAMFFGWILLTTPDNGKATAPGPGIFNSYRQIPLYIRQVVNFGLFACILLAAGLYLDRSSHVVTSARFIQFAFGMFFGAFFVFWVMRIYRLDDRSKIPFQLTLEGLLLLVVFLSGCIDGLIPALDRLNAIKFAGAEISFFHGDGKGGGD